ncbi:MAG: hypothetical protein JNK02_13300 [Planctomycetes bacterium]|nr:hypothetical protein [Planctomycetota bacterium]
MRPAVLLGITLASLSAACAARAHGLELESWSAAWCEPCLRMEREAWSAPDVATWVAKNAVRLRRDLDADARRAAERGVRAIPVTIARRDGRELGRLEGRRDSAALLVWLETMARGGTAVEAAAAELERLGPGADRELRLARALREAGRSTEAAGRLTALWSRPRAARTDVQLGLWDETRTLAAADATARATLHEHAQRVGPGAGGSCADLQDWIELCDATGAGPELVRWVLVHGREPEHAAVVLSARAVLWRWLRAAEEFAAIVDLVEQTVPATDWARQRALVTDFERASFAPEDLARLRAERERDLADLERGLAASGRQDDARAVARLRQGLERARGAEGSR